MPFPELTVHGAVHHPLHRLIARVEVGRQKAAIGQPANRVEADRIGRNGATDPRDGGHVRARVDLEDLDRLAGAVADYEEVVDRAATGCDIKTVGRELSRARGRRAIRIGFRIELLDRRVRRVRRVAHVVARPDQRHAAGAGERRGDDPVGPERDEILGALLPADVVVAWLTGWWRRELRRLGRER